MRFFRSGSGLRRLRTAAACHYPSGWVLLQLGVYRIREDSTAPAVSRPIPPIRSLRTPKSNRLLVRCHLLPMSHLPTNLTTKIPFNSSPKPALGLTPGSGAASLAVW